MANREWMYNGWSCGQPPSHKWIENTNNFLDRAFSMLSLVENDTIKCPCALCRNYVRHKRFDVEIHLCKNGHHMERVMLKLEVMRVLVKLIIWMIC